MRSQPRTAGWRATVFALLLHVTALLALCGLLGCRPAESPAFAKDPAAFAGLWEVIPTPPPFAWLAVVRDDEGNVLGFDADDEGITFADRFVRRFLMTDAGREAFAAFDPSEHPANNCRSPGLPSIAMTPYLQEWVVEADRVEITHEYFSTERTVHLEEGPPPGIERTDGGFASGRFEGEALVIETTALAPIWGGLSRNAPSSDARTVTETYRVHADGLRMVGEIVIRDPKYLRRDLELTVELRRTEPGVELVLFPCDLEASRRHLDDG